MILRLFKIIIFLDKFVLIEWLNRNLLSHIKTSGHVFFLNIYLTTFTLIFSATYSNLNYKLLITFVCTILRKISIFVSATYKSPENFASIHLSFTSYERAKGLYLKFNKKLYNKLNYYISSFI